MVRLYEFRGAMINSIISSAYGYWKWLMELLAGAELIMLIFYDQSLQIIETSTHVLLWYLQ